MFGFPGLPNLSVVAVPKSSASPGLPGQCAFDMTGFYWCYALNRWTKVAGNQFGTGLIYASDGDTNGLFYFLGTLGLTATFVNPQLLSTAPLIATASGVLGGTEEQLVALSDRVAGHFYTTNVANSWVKFDIGVGRTLILTAYSHRARTGFTGDFPTQWKLEGSNDDLTYTLIDGPRSVSITAQNQWTTTTIVGQTIGYRYFKWTNTAANSSGSNYFVLGEAELYGVLAGY